ncbi:hypothetical protein BS50DRAFT_3636 [Corynespora cassiicola Philippines]|uniref:Uncharacterized protein n=1 Tax=Corynespora cassiicola Philippines TaxID=1448308 RepID=A0A2T2P8C5_CORCC|nr:hypothetical protein BS50DRAFT_3636 [Corynespora cassiicola Philippines]
MAAVEYRPVCLSSSPGVAWLVRPPARPLPVSGLGGARLARFQVPPLVGALGRFTYLGYLPACLRSGWMEDMRSGGHASSRALSFLFFHLPLSVLWGGERRRVRGVVRG